MARDTESPWQLIASHKNVRLKAAIKLRQRKGRVRQQRIIVDGAREIERALEAGVELLEVYCDALDSLDPQLKARIEQAAAQTNVVEASAFARLQFGGRRDGIVAVAHAPQHSLEELNTIGQPVVAVLEGMEKPGNIGAVARTADAAGVAAIIVADGVTDIYNPNAIRASLGAIFSVPVIATTTSLALAWLRQHRFNLVAARVGTSTDYRQLDWTAPLAIAFGSESDGLSRQWLAEDIMPVSLPMRGKVDSLNISASAAVLLYEALRQQRLAE